jgi:hypothetical protein
MCARDWHDWGEPESLRGWHVHSVLNGLGSEDFQEFIWNILQHRPGYVGELFFQYVKPGVDMIGRNESLEEDLATALRGAGYDPEQLNLRHEPVNVSKLPPKPLEWDPALREQIMRTELPALAHFGYLSDEQQRALSMRRPMPPHPNLLGEISPGISAEVTDKL